MLLSCSPQSPGSNYRPLPPDPHPSTGWNSSQPSHRWKRQMLMLLTDPVSEWPSTPAQAQGLLFSWQLLRKNIKSYCNAIIQCFMTCALNPKRSRTCSTTTITQRLGVPTGAFLVWVLSGRERFNSSMFASFLFGLHYLKVFAQKGFTVCTVVTHSSCPQTLEPDHYFN